MEIRLSCGLTAALAVFLCVSLSACSFGSDNGARANELAVQACTAGETASVEGFDPQITSDRELAKLAISAAGRSELAQQAAELNERWLLLSQVSADIAAFAQKLLEEREGSGITLNMWNDYKSASNIFLAECKSALESVPESPPENNNPVNASLK